ncbi:MAG: hypothetical protein ACI9LX_001380 [Paraglaciecola sp.]|jgi:uncharacterized protein (DUF1330 family)
MTNYVDPSGQKLMDFVKEPASDSSIVMINLLRYREQADYSGTRKDGISCSGAQAYDTYSKAVTPLLLEVGGCPIWRGSAKTTLIGPSDEQWDDAILVYYPSRQAFLNMIKTQDYSDILFLRDAALLNSRLIETHPTFLPKIVLKGMGLIQRIKGKFTSRQLSETFRNMGVN